MSNGIALGAARPLAAGFAAPVLDSQAAFRAVMDGLARPGRIIPIGSALTPPAPLAPVAGALALTLLDFEVRYHLASSLAVGDAVSAWIGFHTGARMAPPAEAEFAFLDLRQDRLAFAAHAQGSEDYPDRSATLIIQAESLEGGAPLTLAGPGIDGETTLGVPGLPADFVAQWRANRAGFPLGVDLVFVASQQLVGLPRSVRILEGGQLMYVAVKGGERAIENAHRLLADKRRGDREVPALAVAQIDEQLSLAVDRVMSEGSLYDRELAALAIKQARGDLIEAIFLVRAFRTTLPRFGFSEPFETGRMQVRRRVSATYKDLPGGQVLGPTFDYTHRLIDFALAAGVEIEPPATAPVDPDAGMPRVTDIIKGDDLIERNPPGEPGQPVGDLTREPLAFPAERDLRLQNLARGDEGFLLGLAYSTQRGYGRNHPFVGEIRMGEVEVELFVEELGFAVPLGEITLTECEMVTQFKGSLTEPARFTRGYGLSFGHCERRAMSMALVERALRSDEFGEEIKGPAQDQEFVLMHADNVQATGFVEHLKLPHYVDFQAELALLRQMRQELHHRQGAPAPEPHPEAAE